MIWTVELAAYLIDAPWPNGQQGGTRLHNRSPVVTDLVDCALETPGPRDRS